jgi:hypothetical protein
MFSLFTLAYGIGLGYTYRWVADEIPAAPTWGKALMAFFWPLVLMLEAVYGDSN